jgi:hypothetical protein
MDEGESEHESLIIKEVQLLLAEKKDLFGNPAYRNRGFGHTPFSYESTHSHLQVLRCCPCASPNCTSHCNVRCSHFSRIVFNHPGDYSSAPS